MFKAPKFRFVAMSSSSYSSRSTNTGSWSSFIGQGMCCCRKKVKTHTSWTKENPGRRFNLCPDSLIFYRILFFLLFKWFSSESSYVTFSQIELNGNTTKFIWKIYIDLGVTDWMEKLILLKTTSIDLGVITLLCMTRWTLLGSSTASSARNPKVSNAKGINVCWFCMHTFSCFCHFARCSFYSSLPYSENSTHSLICLLHKDQWLNRKGMQTYYHDQK